MQYEHRISLDAVKATPCSCKLLSASSYQCRLLRHLVHSLDGLFGSDLVCLGSLILAKLLLKIFSSFEARRG